MFEVDLSNYPPGILLMVECGDDVGYVLTCCYGGTSDFQNSFIRSRGTQLWVDNRGRSMSGVQHVTKIIDQMVTAGTAVKEEHDETAARFVPGDPITDSWANGVNQSIEELRSLKDAPGDLSVLAHRLIGVIEQQNHALSVVAMRSNG